MGHKEVRFPWPQLHAFLQTIRGTSTRRPHLLIAGRSSGMPFTDEDRRYLALTLAEAEKDPRQFKVGALIVTRDQRMIMAHGGEDADGIEHAEHRAIDKCLEQRISLDGATLYTTLEPCVEHARSPGFTPCAVKILDTTIKRVVIGLIDVDQRVRLEGLKKLRGKNLEVVLCDDLDL